MGLRVVKPRRWVKTACEVAFSVTVPVRVVSELNARGHWSARHRRGKEQAEAIAIAFAGVGGAVTSAAYFLQIGGTACVTLTRLGGRGLDGDNLQSSFKATRDEVARRLGCNDGDPWVEWCYAQQTGGDEGIRIQVEVKAPV